MAKKTQAQIEFSAATKDFDAGIKSMNAQLKTFGKELKLNSTQLKGNADDVGLLQDRQKLLQDELEASKNKVKLQEQALEKCKEMLGENSVEYKNLKNALLDAKNQQAAIENEIKKTEKALADATAETKTAANAYDDLSKEVSEQESELSKLKDEYKNIVLTQGKGSKEAKELEGKINKLNGELKENKKKLNDADDATENLTEEFDEAGDKAEGFNGKLATLGLGFAALAAAAFEAGKTCIEAFNEVDEGADNVIKATGATGKAAEELEGSYKSVASGIVGDFGEIGSVLGEVNTRLGYTGEELEWATIRFLEFAEVTGMDAKQAVQDVSRAIESAGLEGGEFTNILDALTSAGQVTGVSVDTLASALTDNGAVMREMGFNTYETIAMLAQFEKAGINSSSVTKGMQKAIINWAKDGKDAQKEFSKMVEGIQKGSISAGEAYEIFGSKAGVELVDAIKSGRFEYEGMLEVVENSKGSLGQTFFDTVDGGYKLELAMQNCKIALSEVGEVVGTELTPVFNTVSENAVPAVTEAIEKMQAAFQWISDHKAVLITIASVIGVITTAITAYNTVQSITKAIQAAKIALNLSETASLWSLVAAQTAAIAPYVLIVAAIAAVIAIIVLCVKHWDTIKAKVAEFVQSAKEKIEEFKTKIAEKFNEMKTKAVEIWNSVKEFFVNTFNSIKEFFVNIWNSVKTAFTNIWNSLVDVVTTVWNTIKNVVTVAIMFIGSCLSAGFQIITLPFRFIWENCKEYVFAAFEWIKEKIKIAIDFIKNIVQVGFNFVKEKIINPIIEAKNKAVEVFNTIRTAVQEKINALKEKVAEIFNAIKEKVVTPIVAAKDKAIEIFNNIRTAISEKITAARQKVQEVFNSIKEKITTPINNAKQKVSETFNSIKSSVTEKINSIKSSVTSKFNEIKNKIVEPINTAKAKVKEGLDKIKGFFDGLKLKFPNIKLPHFSVKGKFSLDPPQVPKLAISWYAKGGLFTKPTIFANGFGEAGHEYAIPLNERSVAPLAAMITKLERGNIANAIDAMAGRLEQLIDRKIEVALNVDGHTLATATASYSDEVGGTRYELINRGLAIK